MFRRPNLFINIYQFAFVLLLSCGEQLVFDCEGMGEGCLGGWLKWEGLAGKEI